jgi:hypothetical protein
MGYEPDWQHREYAELAYDKLKKERDQARAVACHLLHYMNTDLRGQVGDVIDANPWLTGYPLPDPEDEEKL